MLYRRIIIFYVYYSDYFVLGENFLANKVMDTFGIEEKKYKKIFNETSEVDINKSIKKKWYKKAIHKVISKIQVPSVNETIKEYLEEEKEKFIKKYIVKNTAFVVRCIVPAKS